LPGDTIPIQKAESGHVPRAAALNTPPAKNVPCRDVKSSLGTAFYALGTGKADALTLFPAIKDLAVEAWAWQ
ncbi:MAG TPA: hypothetical protein PK747_07940, partial [Acidobacteriota bacterium]|nr:hypothetical protein [Acidobacteriota bacterium]